MSRTTSPAAPLSSAPTAAQASAYRWVILALAASAFIMAFVSRFAWPPLMPAAMPDLGLTERTQGLALMSAFYLGYILTQVPGGLLCDRFGPRLVLTGALFLQGLGTLGLAFTLKYDVSLVLRVICGLGGGCVYSACLKSMVTWFSPAQRGLAIAVVMSAPTVGIAIPNLAMPALEVSWGWQGAFQIVGLAVIGLAVIMLALMRAAAATPASDSRPSFLVGLKYVLGNRNLRLIALAGFCGLWTQIGFSSVGNDYLVENFGLNLKAAGTVMVLYGLMGLMMSIYGRMAVGPLPGPDQADAHHQPPADGRFLPAFRLDGDLFHRPDRGQPHRHGRLFRQSPVFHRGGRQHRGPVDGHGRRRQQHHLSTGGSLLAPGPRAGPGPVRQLRLGLANFGRRGPLGHRFLRPDQRRQPGLNANRPIHNQSLINRPGFYS